MTMREEFEAWCIFQHGYADEGHEFEWRAWQAATERARTKNQETMTANYDIVDRSNEVERSSKVD